MMHRGSEQSSERENTRSSAREMKMKSGSGQAHLKEGWEVQREKGEMDGRRSSITDFIKQGFPNSNRYTSSLALIAIYSFVSGRQDSERRRGHPAPRHGSAGHGSSSDGHEAADGDAPAAHGHATPGHGNAARYVSP